MVPFVGVDADEDGPDEGVDLVAGVAGTEGLEQGHFWRGRREGGRKGKISNAIDSLEDGEMK